MVPPMRLLTTVLVGLLSCGGTAPASAPDDGTLLTPYLAIGTKLAADSTEGIGELGARVVQNGEKRAAEPGVELLVSGAKKLAGADLDAARVAYEAMSRGMIANMRADEPAQEGHWIVHCPMTFDDKGADWVQKAGPIANVYEGSRMLQCGEKVDW
jgi:Cu(I)/Ag(I) efflux system membrane fusion protein